MSYISTESSLEHVPSPRLSLQQSPQSSPSKNESSSPSELNKILESLNRLESKLLGDFIILYTIGNS